MDILEVLGVTGAALWRVVFNRETAREIAETGAYMSYNMFGEFPSGYYPHNPAAHLLNGAGRVAEIVPLMRLRDVSEEAINQILAGNPRPLKDIRPTVKQSIPNRSRQNAASSSGRRSGTNSPPTFCRNAGQFTPLPIISS